MSGKEQTQKIKVGLGVALGVLVFLIFQYASALWKLMNQSDGMDNKFSRVALDDYLGFVIGQNLLVLIAYAVVGVCAWVILVPAASLLKKRINRRGVAFAAGLVGAFLLHGYFMFRLVHSRPYFTGDAAFGSWYYEALKLPPESLQSFINGALFDALPLIAGLGILIWWFARLPLRGRMVLGVFVLGFSVVGFVREHPWKSQDAVAADNGERPLNVIIIGSDSLRGDRLGYAGYVPSRTDGLAADGVSPHIDEWAKNAAVFDMCRTPIGSTLESGVTVMTSTYPHTHTLRQMFVAEHEIERMQKIVTPLAEVLGNKGYETAVIGDWCAGSYHLTPLGFDEIDVSSFDSFEIYMSQVVFMSHFIVPMYFDNELGYSLFPQIRSFAQFVTPEVVTERVEEKIAKQAVSGKPFFWNVFYSCNHLPYRTTDPYCTMFADPEYRGANATGVDFDINEFIGGTDLESKWNAMPPEEAKQISALYDGCTRQFDDCFGRIIQALENNGLLDNTIVVLSADHGDDLYEPGVTLGHGLGFNGADQSYHVPLAISVPGVPPVKFDEQVRTLEIAPTIAGLLDAEKPDSWEGQDLSVWLKNPDEARHLPFYGETQFSFIQFRVEGVQRPYLPPMDELTRVAPEFNNQFVLRDEYRQPLIDAKQRCLRTRDWKLVLTPVKDAEHHFQLFHTASDPDSRKNLADEYPEVLAQMRKALERWMDDRIETPIESIFPNGEPELK